MARPGEWFVRGESRTAAYEKAVAALKAIPLELRDRAFAEATADETREVWAKKRGVKKATAGSNFWGRLVGKKSLSPGLVQHEEQLPGDDHVSLWLKDGKPSIYVSQPYHLTLEEMRGIVRACDDHALTVNVTTWPSWHFPASVLTLEYTRRDK